MDESSHQMETARRLAEGMEIVNMDFVAASAATMPFPDHSFDVVFSHGLLGHLARPEVALAEFHRVVRPGGFIGLAAWDWDDFALSPAPKTAVRALQVARDLLDARGANTRAGACLGDWMTTAGFTPLACDGWIEEHENPARVVEWLALLLEADALFAHARALREWSRLPGATFGQAWRYATGVRADGARFRRLVTE
jgi:SAM-dependent methyltransferase